MRSAGNFSPEWGYLAPAPSFMRTARIVLVATAVGATAGVGVVLTLIDRPAAEADKTSVAARAIVTSVQAAPFALAAPTVIAAPSVRAAPAAAAPAAPPPNVSAAAPIAPVMVTPPAPPSAPPASQVRSPAPGVATPSIANAAPPSSPVNSGPSEAGVAAAPRPASGMAALSEPGPAIVSVVTDPQDETTPEPPLQKKPKHQQQSAAGAKNQQPHPSLGNVLRRLFGPQRGASYYPNHGL